jgi:hypothetical protein
MEGRAMTRLLTISQAAEKPGMIYFVRTRKAIKIGYATDLRKRLTQLQVGNSNPLKVMLTVPGTKGDEAQLHHLFREHRIRGEWFRPDTFVIVTIGMIETHGKVEGFREFLEDRIRYLQENRVHKDWVPSYVVIPE